MLTAMLVFVTLPQVIGVVVAETEPLARRAAKAVKVTYEDLPAIISIEDAIEANSYYEQYHGDSLVSGDLEAGFAGVS
jgi:xanthine dehydrogenase/oxidase